MKYKYAFGLAALVLGPAMVSAQGDIVNSDLGQFFVDIQGFINDILIPLVFGVALLVFLYGVFKYFIASTDNPEAKQEGKKYMIYAIIGFVVMVSIWGIVNLLSSIIPQSGPPDPPSF